MGANQLVQCVLLAVLAFGLGKGKVTIGTDQGTADAQSHLEAPIRTVL